MSHVLLQESVQGISHEVCEDCASAQAKDDYVLFAVADGHGSSDCARSEVGSRLAVEAVFEVLKRIAQVILKPASSDQEKWEAELLEHRGDSELLGEMAPRIVGEWKRRVKRHWDAHPLQDYEINRMGQKGRNWASAHDPHVYGTTLLAGLLLPNLVLLLRKGDGSCTAVFEDASVIDVLPEEERCVGNVTTSMCDSDADKTMQFEVIDRRMSDPVALYVATDGVDKSLAGPEAVANFMRGVTIQATEGDAATLREEVRLALAQLRDGGVGDDTSLAGYVSVNRARNCVNALRVQREFFDLKFEEQCLSKELASRRRQFERSKRELQEIEAQRSKLSRLEADEEDYRRNVEEYQRLERRRDELRIQQAMPTTALTVAGDASSSAGQDRREAASQAPVASHDVMTVESVPNPLPSNVVLSANTGEDATPAYAKGNTTNNAQDNIVVKAPMVSDGSVSASLSKGSGGRSDNRQIRGHVGRRGPRTRSKKLLFVLGGAGILVVAVATALVLRLGTQGAESGSESSEVVTEQSSSADLSSSSEPKPVSQDEEFSTTDDTWSPATFNDEQGIKGYVEDRLIGDKQEDLKRLLCDRAHGNSGVVKEDYEIEDIASSCLDGEHLALQVNKVLVSEDDFDRFATVWITIEEKAGGESPKPQTKRMLCHKTKEDYGEEDWELCDEGLEGLADAIAQATDFDKKCAEESDGAAQSSQNPDVDDQRPQNASGESEPQSQNSNESGGQSDSENKANDDADSSSSQDDNKNQRDNSSSSVVRDWRV